MADKENVTQAEVAALGNRLAELRKAAVKPDFKVVIKEGKARIVERTAESPTDTISKPR